MPGCLPLPRHCGPPPRCWWRYTPTPRLHALVCGSVGPSPSVRAVPNQVRQQVCHHRSAEGVAQQLVALAQRDVRGKVEAGRKGVQVGDLLRRYQGDGRELKREGQAGARSGARRNGSEGGGASTCLPEGAGAQG